MAWYLLSAKSLHEPMRTRFTDGCMYLQASISYHIEAETKWPTFSRWHFQMHFLVWKCINLEVRINNIPALVQIMAWRRIGDKPLSEPMMVNLLTHVCVTRPQSVIRLLLVETMTLAAWYITQSDARIAVLLKVTEDFKGSTKDLTYCLGCGKKPQINWFRHKFERSIV